MYTDSLVIYVQSISGGNALPFDCQLTDRVSRLAEKIKHDAARFRLDSADIELSTLELFVCLPDERKRKLRFNEGVEHLEDKIVEFDCHQRQLYFQRVSSIIPIKMNFPQDDKVCDVLTALTQKAYDLPISETEAESLIERKKELKLMVKSSDGELEPLDPLSNISDLHRDIVFFDIETRAYQREVYIQRISSINPIKVNISSDIKVCDLTEVIIQKACDLSSTEAKDLKEKKSEVKLMVKSSDGELKPLNPRLSISELDRAIIFFDIETDVTKSRRRPMKIYVRHVSGGRQQTVMCWENDSVFDVINEITSDLQRFGLGKALAAEVFDPDKTMVLLDPDERRGQQAVPMNTLARAYVLKDRQVSFKMDPNRQDPIEIDDLVTLCVGQTIVFMGSAGHGKSSTINTIAEVLPGFETPIADEWNRFSAGTMVITPHAIKVGGNTFNLLDVPGAAMGSSIITRDRDEARERIKWILEGKFPKDSSPWFWKANSAVSAWITYMKRANTGKVHAVVIVHNGANASVDGQTRVVVDVARTIGKGIPVLAILTHVDRLENNDVIRQKQQELAIVTGINESSIFPLSNLKTEQEAGARDRMKDQYILMILKQMLGRSKRFKEHD